MAFDITQPYNTVEDACGNRYFQQGGSLYSSSSPYAATTQALCNPLPPTAPPVTQVSLFDVNQTISNNVATAIIWTASPRDDTASWTATSATTPTRIYVPAGYTKMRASYHCEWTADATKTGYRSLRMQINGVALAAPYFSTTDVRVPNGTITDHSAATSLIIPCVPGDYIEIMVRHTLGVGLTLNIGATQANFCVIEWYS